MRAIGKSSVSSVLKVILDILWYLSIGLVVLGAVLFAVVLVTNDGMLGHMTVPVLVDIDPGIYSVSAPDHGIEAAELEDVRADLRFRGPSGWLVAYFMALFVVGISILLVILGKLRRVVATLAAGTPFVAANAARIRFIGWAVIVGQLAEMTLEYLGEVVVRSSFEATGLVFRAGMNMSVQSLFWGFIILAVAEVFRLGVEMREEQSLTI